VAYGVFVVGVAVYLLKDTGILPATILTDYSMDIGSSIEAALFSLALADRINILKLENATSQQKLIEQLNEYNELQVKLNHELEEKVELRTRELRESQRQLLQREKLAALGDVMAGIAHEIQNPLNFINNFSEVNAELIDELKLAMNQQDYTEVNAIADDLKENLQKVTHHGKRADNIVKGMLMHSASSSGALEEVSLNGLVDESLRICYSAWIVKHATFKITLQTDYDPSIGMLNLMKQDFGRALLNIFSNAVYAVSQKTLSDEYEAQISVTTQKLKDHISIRIRDNGTGIKAQTIGKIFQPFFTTKPSGEGTGLGLSLSYDAIKAHNGDIRVDSKEGEFTEFNITVPIP
jgi:signal transduction histidine kinase